MSKSTHTQASLVGLMEALDDVRACYDENFNSLSTEQLRWKASEKTWSIAQVLDHVVLTNTTYVNHMEKILSKEKNQHKAPKEVFKSDWMGKRFMKALMPDSGEKFKSPRIFMPATHPQDVLSRLRQSNRLLKSFIQKAAQYDLNIRIPLLESRLIRLRLGDRISTLIMHEKRHARQAMQIKLHPEFPKE